ncbi:MAG: VOC family protein [Bdellovibrionaceae bacterium]|nr:VOC family protein [Pseudobdellovibrionaceae bacterium]NUM60134.1 VOC family protein [Pseudobdellovibrionaceae bacterium]
MLKAYTCIWSNQSAAEMVKFYKSIFKGSKVGKYSYWGKNPMGVKEGSVLTAHITILGQKLMLLNGYTDMPFNESISFIVPCKTQREIDYYWKKLTSGGGRPVQCGWVVDKFGLRWQIAPADFDKWNTSKNKAKKEAMMVEMWKMKKLDIKKLKAAYDKA